MDFYAKIDRFNRMYKLPVPDSPSITRKEDLKKFHSILDEELSEVEDLFRPDSEIINMTDLADWLGDIIIYCHTFARSKGLPMARILSAIMDSNFTKLSDSGEPIYDDRGKVMKGKNFVPPENLIDRIIVDEILRDGLGGAGRSKGEDIQA